MKIQVSKLPSKYNFIAEWMTAAEGKDLFFRFFCYFLAYNHLYSKSKEMHEDETRDMHDMPVIVRFMVKVLDNMVAKGQPYALPKTLRWDVQGCSLMKPVKILSEPELTWRSTDPRIDWILSHEGVPRESDYWLSIKIFLRIYKIRCNLFHGEKSPCNADDVERVADASVVLEDFLQKYLSCGLYREEVISK